MAALIAAGNPLLARVTCASIVDAVGRQHAHRSHIVDLVTPSPGRALFGPAATIAFLPLRRDIFDPVRNDFARLFYEALGDSGLGKVLVISSNGHPDVSLGGARKLSRVENNHLEGVLCDGRLRDFAGLAGYDFATYCTGEAVQAGGNDVMPYEANVPVVVGGVAVFPGDYVYADSSGAVVIPSAHVEATLQEAARIEEQDAASVESIRFEDQELVMREGSPRPSGGSTGQRVSHTV